MSTEQNILAYMQKLRRAKEQIQSRFGDLEDAARLVDGALWDLEALGRSSSDELPKNQAPRTMRVDWPKPPTDQDS